MFFTRETALALVLTSAGCAHRSPVVPTAGEGELQRAPMPINLVFVNRAREPFEGLSAKTERLTRERFEARGILVRGDADETVEIELVSIGGRVVDNGYRYCVRVQGRIVRGDQRFLAVDVVKERCEAVGFSSHAAGNVILVVDVVMALVGAKDPDDEGVLKLYDSAVTELIGVLAQQATRRRAAPGRARQREAESRPEVLEG